MNTRAPHAQMSIAGRAEKQRSNPMVQFAEFTTDEYAIVIKIVERAVKAGIYDDALEADMDLSAVHLHCPLRLADLLAADDFNFAHDLAGIQRHINRETGMLEGFFLPRFAR